MVVGVGLSVLVDEVGGGGGEGVGVDVDRVDGRLGRTRLRG